MNRYLRQIQVKELGPEGQQKLSRAKVLLIGCGALGSNVAAALVRAGIGRLRLVDRDRVELINLHRQFLYDETDVASGQPKAKIAARKLQHMNSEITVEGIVCDIDADNIDPLMTDMDLVIDGTDNLETRYIINDASIRFSTPWIYGGVVGIAGMMMPIFPGRGPCFRCLFPVPPAPGIIPTVETHGVLSMVPTMIGALQTTEAIKIITDKHTDSHLHVLDVWHGTWQKIYIGRDETCPACGPVQGDRRSAT